MLAFYKVALAQRLSVLFKHSASWIALMSGCVQLYSQTVPAAPEPRVLAVHGRAGVLESHPGLATNYSNNLHHTTKIIAPVGDR